MEKKTLVFHSDPGHGWVEVDIYDLHLLGICDKISSCSYLKGNTAYLEEDCDAGVYIDALKAKHPGIELKVIERHKENTPIRNYGRFNY